MTDENPATTIAAMAEPLRVVIEIDRESEPIRGTLTGPDGCPRAYLGWLAVIDALEDWRRLDPVAEVPCVSRARSGT